MGKAYVRGSGTGLWTPMEKDILSCLEDPLEQGLYYLPRNGKRNLGESPFQHSSEFPPTLGNGWVHFASNIGFSIDYSCTSRVASPDGLEACTIIQLSEGIIIDYIKNNIRRGNDGIRMSFLIPNMLKQMDGGRYFIFDGPYEEVSQAIRARGYKIAEPNEGELNTEWFLRLKREVSEQRKRLVTDELVERVNRERFSITKEELLKCLSSLDIPA